MPVARYRLTGITPLLQNNPQKMSKVPAAVSKKGVLTGVDEAESLTYRLPSGQLYHRGTAILKSMANGGNRSKIGRFGAEGILLKIVRLPDFLHDECPLFDPETSEPLHDYEVNTQRVVNAGRNRGSVPRSRPMLMPWACDVTFEYDEPDANPAMILTFFEQGGQYCGIGDFRPQFGGPYGRYSVRLLGEQADALAAD